MGIEFLLLPGVIAASAAIVWAAAFKGAFSQSGKPSKAQSAVSVALQAPSEPSQVTRAFEDRVAESEIQSTPVLADTSSIEATTQFETPQPSQPTAIEPLQMSPDPAPQAPQEITPTTFTTPVSEPASPISEAPAPFEQPQAAYTENTISSTAMPTDVTAVSNITSPVENATPALVISRPKRARRPRKTAAIEGAPKRKRTPRAKPSFSVAEPTPAVVETSPSSSNVPEQHTEITQ